MKRLRIEVGRRLSNRRWSLFEYNGEQRRDSAVSDLGCFHTPPLEYHLITHFLFHNTVIGETIRARMVFTCSRRMFEFARFMENDSPISFDLKAAALALPRSLSCKFSCSIEFLRSWAD